MKRGSLRAKEASDSFRRMTVDRWIRGGKTSKEVADDPGISVNSLRAWKALYLSEPGGPQQQNLQEEIVEKRKSWSYGGALRVTDITYIQTTAGFACLTTLMDPDNREGIG